MNRIRLREIIILTVSVVIMINLIYFKYIYNGYTQKRDRLTASINSYDNKISSALSKFHRNLNLLKNIVYIKKRILFSKKDIELLKSSRENTFDMSNILKTLLVKSGVSVYSVSLSKTQASKNKKTYSFKVKINDSLEKILKFMDSIENFSDNMYIPSYSVKFKDGKYVADMVVNFDYVGSK